MSAQTHLSPLFLNEKSGGRASTTSTVSSSGGNPQHEERPCYCMPVVSVPVPRCTERLCDIRQHDTMMKRMNLGPGGGNGIGSGVAGGGVGGVGMSSVAPPTMLVERRAERIFHALFQSDDSVDRVYNSPYYCVRERQMLLAHERSRVDAAVADLWQVRGDKRGSPLLILHLDSLIGDYGKHHFFVDQPPAVYIRPGVIAALENLSRYFRLAATSRMAPEHVREILMYLFRPPTPDRLASTSSPASIPERGSFRFDRVYLEPYIQPVFVNTHGSRSACRLLVPHIQNYQHVYEEFQITPDNISRDVLVVGCLDLDHDEIESRNGDDLLMDVSCGLRPYFSNCTPYLDESTFPSDRQLREQFIDRRVPIQVLVPNPRAQSKSEAVSFPFIAKLIKELFMVGVGNFEQGWKDLRRSDVKKLRATIHSQYMWKRSFDDWYEGAVSTLASDGRTLSQVVSSSPFSHRCIVLRGKCVPKTDVSSMEKYCFR